MTDLFDAATMQRAMNDGTFFMSIKDTPQVKLRHWRYDMRQGTITKRAWRRLRGRVKAGLDIPEPPALVIMFDALPLSTRKLAPFISPLYRKD